MWDLASLLLDAESPRDAARRTLDWLRGHAQARSIALWHADGSELRLELSISADDRTLAEARGLWRLREKGPREESPALFGEEAVLLSTRPSDMLVYVDGVDPKKVDFETLADGAAIVVDALRREPSALHGPGGGSSVAALRRAELFAVLSLSDRRLTASEVQGNPRAPKLPGAPAHPPKGCGRT